MIIVSVMTVDQVPDLSSASTAQQKSALSFVLKQTDDGPEVWEKMKKMVNLKHTLYEAAAWVYSDGRLYGITRDTAPEVLRAVGRPLVLFVNADDAAIRAKLTFLPERNRSFDHDHEASTDLVETVRKRDAEQAEIEAASKTSARTLKRQSRIATSQTESRTSVFQNRTIFSMAGMEKMITDGAMKFYRFISEPQRVVGLSFISHLHKTKMQEIEEEVLSVALRNTFVTAVTVDVLIRAARPVAVRLGCWAFENFKVDDGYLFVFTTARTIAMRVDPPGDRFLRKRTALTVFQQDSCEHTLWTVLPHEFSAARRLAAKEGELGGELLTTEQEMLKLLQEVEEQKKVSISDGDFESVCGWDQIRTDLQTAEYKLSLRERQFFAPFHPSCGRLLMKAVMDKLGVWDRNGNMICRAGSMTMNPGFLSGHNPSVHELFEDAVSPEDSDKNAEAEVHDHDTSEKQDVGLEDGVFLQCTCNKELMLANLQYSRDLFVHLKSAKHYPGARANLFDTPPSHSISSFFPPTSRPVPGSPVTPHQASQV